MKAKLNCFIFGGGCLLYTALRKAMQKQISDRDVENAELTKRVLALEEQLKNGSKTPSVAAPATPEVQAQPVVTSKLEQMLETAMCRLKTMEEMFNTKEAPVPPKQCEPAVSSKTKGTDSEKGVPASTPTDATADDSSSDSEDDEYVTTPDGQTAP